MKFKGIGTLHGKQVEITINAKSRDEAFSQMKQSGYENISIVEVSSIFSRRSVSVKDIAMCFRQLAAFQSSGESFTKSLANIADVTPNKTLKDALLDIKRKVEYGQPISVAFAEYKFFPKIIPNLLKVGEASGEMEKTLEELAKYLQQVHNIEQGVKSALMYPKVISGVMALAMAFVVAQVLPQFRSFYTDMHIEMPFVTKCLYALSDFMNEDWFIALPALGLIFYFFKNINKYMPQACDTMCIKLPLVKSIMINLYMFRFSKTMQILIGSGVNILEALKLIADAMENHHYTTVLTNSIPMVKAGEGITSSIRRNDTNKVYDAMAIAFLNAGEETNNIPELMNRASEYYQKTLNTEIDNFGKAIEPILLVIIAVFVFFLVASVYLPIFRMSQIANQ